tara:strand:+ start:828 stop:4940 length:4113 start_codon:yes stop_codon:yes gene_type:complete
MNSNKIIIDKNKTMINDFDDEKLNELFEGLDEKIKQQILKYDSKDIQKDILKNMMDPELNEFFDNLPSKSKKSLDAQKIRDKYIMLKQMMNKEKKTKEVSKDEPSSIKGVYNTITQGEGYLLPVSWGNFLKNPLQDTEEEEEETKEKATATKATKDVPEVKVDLKTAPREIFDEDNHRRHQPQHKKSSQQRLDEMVSAFYAKNNFTSYSVITDELEVKFGTKGVKPLMRNDYDNVIKKLKSLGFTPNGSSGGEYYLRVKCEFLDSATGVFKVSNVRTEIIGLDTIQDYCKTNSLKNIWKQKISYVNKKQAIVDKERVQNVDFDDFNFRVSYNSEDKVSPGIQHFITDNWQQSKKEFRFLNRVTFTHPTYPVKVDISIVKYGNRLPDRFGRENRGPPKRVFTLNESNVFNNAENYEIEIEIDNTKIGVGTKFDNPKFILVALRKVIKYVLCGLQGTNYPVSYPEQKNIMNSYMKMIWKDEYNPTTYVKSKHFIGPNSITLQLKNISKIDENSSDPNIRKDFVVTDKADGQRHLMVISGEGKIYLINTNMDVIFTGAKTQEKKCFNSILDGELISHDKNNKFINLYAAFDIYYMENKDVRDYTFMLKEEEEDIYKSRYQLLKWFDVNLKAASVIETNKKETTGMAAVLASYKQLLDVISPIRFSVKEFFPSGNKMSIFEGCQSILKKEKEGRFEYVTDGLIFTHAFYGVGSTVIGKAGPKTKITWEHSFKWKPPQYNTVDFLVTTIKSANGDDEIKSVYEDGINTMAVVQSTEYKTVELRCGFNESKDGYINPCQDVIDDKFSESTNRPGDKQENNYVPMRFYPTEPYDPTAGLCNIMLTTGNNGNKQLFSEEGDAIEDNTIVEFRYDLDKEPDWRWIPLRVRHDKTAKIRRGETEFGNSYKVCNDNWKTIQPGGRITEEMLYTGLDIPDISVSEDVYYNKPSGLFKTEALKDFHNLYVKKNLIFGTTRPGDTLIDFACGKAGDLPKWINSKLSFVFGVDVAKDNLENRMDGACARFLNMKKIKKNIPHCLFVNGNSAHNIKDGSAMLSDRAKQITNAVFGVGPKEHDKIGKGVARQYGKGADGFNVSSCQFAVHYFFETPDMLKGFVKNIAECTVQNGYFMGTCYDGNSVFNELQQMNRGEGIKLLEDGKKIWEITKEYPHVTFDDNSSSLGCKINVYQESINQYITEYLVNFEYLTRVMGVYGFELIGREEAKEHGFPAGSGLFNELFFTMLEEIDTNKFKSKNYGKAPFMTKNEKKISFLNRYFIFKKVRIVNTETVVLELGEYNETTLLHNSKDTAKAQTAAKEVTRVLKPKIRKLSKKLLLVGATEAVDEVVTTEAATQKPKKTTRKKVVQPKIKLVYNSDSDGDDN